MSVLENNLFEKAVDLWGANSQIDMAIEEMSELIKALLKYRRADNRGEDCEEETRNIREEIGDVYIMLGQMEALFGSAEKQMETKLDRLEVLVRESKIKRGY